MALGNLVVKLGLDAAEYTRGLTRAEANAQRFRRNLEAQVASVARIATGIAAVGAAIGGAVLAIDRLAKSAAVFKDMEERTGASAESLASLAVAAETAGVSMTDVEGMMVRLTKTLTGVDDESKAAGAALAAIGVPIEQFKRLDPVGQFEALAKALENFADGSGKTAVAVALLGRNGAQALPVLKELAAAGRQTILTQAQIDAADRYADAQARATAQLRLYAQAASTQALPALTAFTAALATTVKEVTGVTTASAALAANNSITSFAENGARALGVLVSGLQFVSRGVEQTGILIGGVAANLSRLAQGDIRGAAQAVRDTFKDIRDAGNRPLFSSQLEQALQAQRNIATGMAAISSGNDDRLDRMAKKLSIVFDGAIPKVRALKAEVDDLAKFLERLRGEEFAASIGFDTRTIEDVAKLDEAFTRGRVSIAEYGRLLDVILENTPRFRQEQEKLNRTYEEWVDLQRKGIESAEDFLANVQAEAEAIGKTAEQIAALNAECRRGEALKGVTDPTAIGRINASLDAAKALAVENIERQRATEAALRGVDAGRGLVQRYQEELGALGKTGLALEEYRIELERTQALLGVTDESQRAYINSLYDTAKAIAATVDVQRTFVDDAIRLNDSFRSSFADNLAAVADGTKSFKDAVKSMADDWVKSLNRMAANKLGDALFGPQGTTGEGMFGGISKWFAGLFNFGAPKAAGGATDATGVAALTAAASTAAPSLSMVGVNAGLASTALSTAVTTTVPPLTLLATNAGLAASALATVATSSAGKGLGSLFGGFSDSDPFGIGGWAFGGMTPVNEPIWVGERGRELFVPKVAGEIVANHDLRRTGTMTRNVTVNNYLPPTYSRESADQIAMRLGARIQRVMYRNA